MKQTLKLLFSILTIVVLMSVFNVSASATSYASQIYVSTYLPEPIATENVQHVALHYTSGNSYLLTVGVDGNENISCSFAIANNGNTLYVTNNGATGGYLYMYFISLDNCQVSGMKMVNVQPNARYQVAFSETNKVDAFYSYGLPSYTVGSYTTPYALQVNWHLVTDNNIATIRDNVSGINNKCQMIIDYLKTIEGNQDDLYNKIIWTNTYLNSIDQKMTTNNSKLDQLITAIQNQKQELIDNSETVSSAYNLDNGSLEEEEGKYNPEDVTIPEWDSSLVSGSGTYWDLVEQVLNTSGLLPVIIFALVIGLVSFIIGKKV